MEAQRNNAEFMALSEQLSRLGRELDDRTKRQKEMSRKKDRLEVDTESKQNDSIEYRRHLQEALDILDEER